MTKKLTLREAKNLEYGDMLYEIGQYNADGTLRRWRVIGKPKVWKRSPKKVQVSLKHGLYSFTKIDEFNLHFMSLKEPKSVSKKKLRGMI
jgi:hypothetical protein